MGEIADMMLDGTMCAGCGEWLNDGEDGDGFPEYCSGCQADERREREEREAVSKKVSGSIASKVVKDVEKAFGMPFDPGVAEQFRKQIHGLLRGMYVSDHGVIRHPGIDHTIQNNLLSQKKAEQRKAKATK